MEYNNICIYCGSSSGFNEVYTEKAIELCKYLAGKNKSLVYGGGSVGIMETIADTFLEAGGTVYGVITKYLAGLEVGHDNLSELYIVDDMHQRKKKMSDMADAFILLPGGLGSLEEIFEVVTWGQLNIHSKPSVIYNINGYYDKLIEFLKHASAEGFIKKEHVDMILIAETPQDLTEKLNNYSHPTFDKV